MSTEDGSAVGQVQAGLAVLNAADVVGLPDEQVRSEILALLTCMNQLTGALLARIGTFDLRDLSQVDAQRASSTWLVEFGLMSKGAALRWLVYARHLTKLPALAEGLRQGRVSTEQLAKVAELVRHIGIDRVRDYDVILAQLCASAGPGEVDRACVRIWARVDPDGAEPDPKEEFDRREITFAHLGSTMYIRGRLDPDGAAALTTAVEALMRPPTPGDERTAAQRRADAVVDLARGALAGDSLPSVGGERPHVGILITPQILFGSATPTPAGCTHGPAGPVGTPESAAQQDVGAECPQQTAAPDPAMRWCDCDPLTRAGVPHPPDRPWLNWVGEVSPDLARRLACDGVIWRLVLDPRTGLPLDVGRSHRIVPWWMRKALWARDRTCRWPGCDVPAEWTDAHHAIPWWRGGVTAIEHLISLCRYHHGLLHEGHWTLAMDRGTGEVSARRPDGRPYELGPSRPWTTPSHHGPQPVTPRRRRAPEASDPPSSDAA